MSDGYTLPWQVKPHTKELIRTGIFNSSAGAMRAEFIVNAGSDTDYKYTVTVSRKDGRRIAETQRAWVKAFCEGIIYASG